MMDSWARWISAGAVCTLLGILPAAGQDQKPSGPATEKPADNAEIKPLSNADVVSMVKNGLPERTIIRAVQAGPSAFDITPDALVTLHNDGISEKILDAMIAASKRRQRASNRPNTSGRAAAGNITRGSRGEPPAPTYSSVSLINGEARELVRLERTRLAQSKTKPASLGDLAKDRAMDEALRTGVSTARDVGGRTVGGAIGTAAEAATSVLTRSGGDRDVTYVWMLPGQTSETVSPSEGPIFEVSLEKLPALKATDYAPAIVRLTPSSNGNRLVGATEGKVEAATKTSLDWPLYSRFVEDRVPVQVSAVTVGVWRVTPTGSLASGEYGVVLRPLSKDRKFAGADVARNQGDGVAFNSVWAFSVR